LQTAEGFQEGNMLLLVAQIRRDNRVHHGGLWDAP